MKKLFFLATFLFFSVAIFSQISEGGLPPSFVIPQNKSLNEIKPFKIEVKKDINKLISEDNTSKDKNTPLRIATIIPAEYDLAKDGEWTNIDNKSNKICRLSISSPGALGLILSYEEFYIPYGGRLFIYSKDKGQVLGAYTHRTNPKGKEFSTEIVYGDELVLEYVDAKTGELPRIKIKDIGYGYNNIFDYTKVEVEGEGFNESGNCQVNINCKEGQNWQLQKKGVARSYTKIGNRGWFRCSGSLINNVNQDKTSFYLSAYHCFFESGYTADFATAQFYFNYEFPGCEDMSAKPQTAKSIIGAQLLVTSPIDGGSDGILLKLNSEIPEDYDVYFNGWDINNIPAKNGVTIHHPQGDVKKISTYTSPLVTGTYADAQSTSIDNAHWIVRWSATLNGHGTTEGGSSGAPIFNQDGLIVGALTGGKTSCSNKTEIDFYGKMWYHWNQHPNTSYHMQPYLDPTNKVNKINGLANISLPDEKLYPAYAYWDDPSTKSQLYIQITDNDDKMKNLTIVNLRGYNALKKTEGFSSNLYTISVIGWPRGVYIIHLETEKGKRHSFKIIK